MGMTREERDFARQISDETKEERRKAIDAKGALLNASRTTELRRILQNECLIQDDKEIGDLIKAFGEAGSDDEVDVKEAIKTKLRDTVKRVFQTSNPKEAFLNRGTNSLFSIVDAAMTERDAAIVREGGPARPKFMQFNY